MQHDVISCCLYTLTAVFNTGGRSVQMTTYLMTIRSDHFMFFFFFYVLLQPMNHF